MIQKVKILKGRYTGKICDVIGYQGYMHGTIESTPRLSHRLVVVRPRIKAISYLFDNIEFLPKEEQKDTDKHDQYCDEDKYISIPCDLLISEDIEKSINYVNSSKDISTLEENARKQVIGFDDDKSIYIYKLVRVVYKEPTIKTIVLPMNS